MGPGVKRLTIGNIDNFITEQPLLVYRDCLLMLANTHTVQLCTMSDCKSLVDFKNRNYWICILHNMGKVSSTLLYI